MKNKKLSGFLNSKIERQISRGGKTRKELVNKLTEELGIEKSEVEEILAGESEPSRDDKAIFADVLKFNVAEFKNMKTSTVEPDEDDDDNLKGVVKTFRGMFSDFAEEIGNSIKGALKNVKDEDGNPVEVKINMSDAVEKMTGKFENEVKGKAPKKAELNNEAIDELSERLDTLEDENKELRKKLKNSAQKGAGGRSLGNRNAFSYDRTDDENEVDENEESNDRSLTKQLTAHFNNG